MNYVEEYDGPSLFHFGLTMNNITLEFRHHNSIDFPCSNHTNLLLSYYLPSKAITFYPHYSKHLNIDPTSTMLISKSMRHTLFKTICNNFNLNTAQFHFEIESTLFLFGLTINNITLDTTTISISQVLIISTLNLTKLFTK